MKKRIIRMIGLGVWSMFLFSLFAQGNAEVQLKGINVEGDAVNWFEESNIVYLKCKEQIEGSIADVGVGVFSPLKDPIYGGFLRNDGTRGDVDANDEEWGCMFPGNLPVGSQATFLISYGPPQWEIQTDSFLGNKVSFGANGVQVLDDNTSAPTLSWLPVPGAEDYWVGVWEIDKVFLDSSGYVDIAGRVAEFEDLEVSSITLTGLTPGEYKWIVYADGEGGPHLDGGAAFGGTVTVTPEPVSSILSLLGLFSLFGVKNFRRKIFG